MVFKPTNSISYLTRGWYYIDNEFEKSGIHKLSCNTCGFAYIGHTVRDMSTRYKEHYWCIETNNPRSASVLHILKNWHENGILTMTMKLVKKVTDQVHTYAIQQANL